MEQQQEYSIVQGRATFKPTANKKLLKFKLNNKNKLQKLVWEIMNKRYLQQKWDKIFYEMLTCEATKVYLYSNKYPPIVRQIEHVYFKELKILSLLQNNIENIQGISWLNCPKISQLYLSKNHILNIKSLSKIESTHLKKLTMSVNQIGQIQALCRLPFDSRKVQYLQLECTSDKYPTCQDIAIVAKINCAIIKKIRCKHSVRINQIKIKEMLRNRFLSAKMF